MQRFQGEHVKCSTNQGSLCMSIFYILKCMDIRNRSLYGVSKTSFSIYCELHCILKGTVSCLASGITTTIHSRSHVDIKELHFPASVDSTFSLELVTQTKDFASRCTVCLLQFCTRVKVEAADCPPAALKAVLFQLCTNSCTACGPSQHSQSARSSSGSTQCAIATSTNTTLIDLG